MPKKTKTVKAFAVIDLKGKLVESMNDGMVWPTRYEAHLVACEEAEQIMNTESHPINRQVIPVTITYQLPTKK